MVKYKIQWERVCVPCCTPVVEVKLNELKLKYKEKRRRDRDRPETADQCGAEQGLAGIDRVGAVRRYFFLLYPVFCNAAVSVIGNVLCK